MLGCSGLLVLTFGGCLIAGAVLFNRAKQAMSEPYNAAAAEQELGDVPRYPGATQNINLSRALRMAAGTHKTAFRADKVIEVAYNSPDGFDKVGEWYETRLKQAGYSAGKDHALYHLYVKGSDVIGIRDLILKRSGNCFVLMRITGAKNPDGG